MDGDAKQHKTEEKKYNVFVKSIKTKITLFFLTKQRIKLRREWEGCKSSNAATHKAALLTEGVKKWNFRITFTVSFYFCFVFFYFIFNLSSISGEDGCWRRGGIDAKKRDCGEKKS